ncbi:hypothetical protein EDD30_4909 [Couchioplanes caeruleus]|uniref:Uncharacterized protein n=1 Tax=Couchioplanes caeruleus TaxID=56438 RepID=A0A3N1GP39_9ACTN|nr:hypothetical protein EDD30_4909 [Couchioplanes caeruleus]
MTDLTPVQRPVALVDLNLDLGPVGTLLADE